MKNKLNLPFTIVILLSLFFFCCERSTEIEEELASKEPVILQSCCTDTSFLLYKSFVGSDEGAIITNDTTLKNQSFLDFLGMKKALKKTEFSFIEGTDSVYINGIFYVGRMNTISARNDAGAYTFSTSNNHKFQYKFQNNILMLKKPEEIQFFDFEWISVGYGNLEKFSIFVENKSIYQVFSGGTVKEYYSFIDPYTVESLIKSDYANVFFNETHRWNYLNTFGLDNFPEYHVALGYIIKYNFELQKNEKK